MQLNYPKTLHNSFLFITILTNYKENQRHSGLMQSVWQGEFKKVSLYSHMYWLVSNIFIIEHLKDLKVIFNVNLACRKGLTLQQSNKHPKWRFIALMNTFVNKNNFAVWLSSLSFSDILDARVGK